MPTDDTLDVADAAAELLGDDDTLRLNEARALAEADANAALGVAPPRGEPVGAP